MNTKHTQEQIAAMALSIAQAASAYAERGTAAFPDMPDMRLMYAEDRLGLLHVAALFNHGLLVAAYRAARNMDTAARDVIPDEAYRAMAQAAAEADKANVTALY